VQRPAVASIIVVDEPERGVLMRAVGLPHGGRRLGTSPWLRAAAAGALGVSAYLHVDLAQGPLWDAGEVTLAGLFTAQAVAAVLAGAWLLLRDVPPAWAAVTVVALGSLAALLATTYVRLPALGPFPAVYDPLWFPEKVAAAVAAAVASAAGVGVLTRVARAPRGDVR
jgi:hypothetical protein